jgi:predicted transcriptional regulator
VTAEYEPTAEQRAIVESAAAFGLTQADIAEHLGICEKTLRKHFREELNGGKFKANMKVTLPQGPAGHAEP